MADYRLTQTGAEVQEDLDKVESLADIESIGDGLNLDDGELSIDTSGASVGEILSKGSSGIVWGKLLPVLTTNPATDPNIPSGQSVICVLSSEPVDKWDNIIYIIVSAS